MPLSFLPDYEERVYAGVLGKIIGVYLGRPFEGWSYEALTDRFGEVNYYVHENLGVPLIVTDDDISGTFTFVKALDDYGNSRDIQARDIGQSWLNYIIERQTILWWGGMGNSTEHTAFYRLKAGHEAPYSGSIELNGKTVAEQIGAQIFIDGWGLVAPGDPELAAELARKAGSVSHDGEAIYGAQVIAALEAQAFVESDLNQLLDTATRLIPGDSVIYRLIADLREWHRIDEDWRKTRERIVAHYGYDKYGGNCHMVPNHALIILGLLYGEDDFQRSLMITNTSGWDTDCNSGNIGCIMGVKNGLAGIDAGPDFRGPVADRIVLATADGGNSITDAARQAYFVAGMGRKLAGQAPVAPKNGAIFNFELPGSTQGFLPENDPDSRDAATVENVEGHSAEGTRSLAIRYSGIASGRSSRVATATFVTPEYAKMGGYSLVASPTLYSGQTVKARISADAANADPATVALYLKVYGKEDRLEFKRGPKTTLTPGSSGVFDFVVPSTDGAPIEEIGIEITSKKRIDGSVYLDYLTWDGAPSLTLSQPAVGGEKWRQAWVRACDDANLWNGGRIMQDEGEGVGLLIQGTREWKNYEASANVAPRSKFRQGGIAVCVQGRKRWVALTLAEGGKARLVKALDGETILAEADLTWEPDQIFDLSLSTVGGKYVGKVNGAVVLEATDADRPLESGAVAFVVESGRLDFNPMTVKPA